MRASERDRLVRNMVSSVAVTASLLRNATAKTNQGRIVGDIEILLAVAAALGLRVEAVKGPHGGDSVSVHYAGEPTVYREYRAFGAPMVVGCGAR